jgi:hypothetical protein
MILKFLLMPFKLCNVSSTFTTLMNSIFHENLDEFMIICINDILVYSKTMKEHVEHLEYVLNKLRKNQLLTNKGKIEFAQKKWTFWGIFCHKKVSDLTLKSWKPNGTKKDQYNQRNLILLRPR